MRDKVSIEQRKGKTVVVEHIEVGDGKTVLLRSYRERRHLRGVV